MTGTMGTSEPAFNIIFRLLSTGQNNLQSYAGRKCWSGQLDSSTTRQYYAQHTNGSGRGGEFIHLHSFRIANTFFTIFQVHVFAIKKMCILTVNDAFHSTYIKYCTIKNYEINHISLLGEKDFYNIYINF